MKSLRELHDDEQLEAAWRDAEKRFNRRVRRLNWGFFIFEMIAVAAILALLARHYRK